MPDTIKKNNVIRNIVANHFVSSHCTHSHDAHSPSHLCCIRHMQQVSHGLQNSVAVRVFTLHSAKTIDGKVHAFIMSADCNSRLILRDKSFRILELKRRMYFVHNSFIGIVLYKIFVVSGHEALDQLPLNITSVRTFVNSNVLPDTGMLTKILPVTLMSCW